MKWKYKKNSVEHFLNRNTMFVSHKHSLYEKYQPQFELYYNNLIIWSNEF